MISQASRNMAHNLDDLRERWELRKSSQEITLADEILMLSELELVEFVSEMSISQADELERCYHAMILDIRSSIQRVRSARNRSRFNELTTKRKRVGQWLNLIQRNKPKRQKTTAEYFRELVEPYISEELFEELCVKARRLSRGESLID